MNLKDIKIAYFIGIGGIGMSALARYLKARGISVFGYDKTITRLTLQLEEEGIPIVYDDHPDLIPFAFKENTPEALVVYTPAIPEEHRGLTWLRKQQIQLYKRAEILGFISKKSFTIAVSGTHGKTTTCALISHALVEAGINHIALLGGIATNYNNNFIHFNNGRDIHIKPLVVLEADEFDRSFLQLSPDIAIVTSTDADHLDVYGQSREFEKSFQDFLSKVAFDGIAIIKQLLPLYSPSCLWYGHREDLGPCYANIKIKNSVFYFDYISAKHSMKEIQCGIPGKHNIENATAAITALIHLGIETETIQKAIGSFRGVKRRFEYIINTEQQVYIDDYAHHPTELKSFIQAVRQMYPGKNLHGIFQPHLYSRTRDFAKGFAQSLDLLDECWLLDIYPARELPIVGVTSQTIADHMKLTPKLLPNHEVITSIRFDPSTVLLTMGAGDIDHLPSMIKEVYEQSVRVA